MHYSVVCLPRQVCRRGRRHRVARLEMTLPDQHHQPTFTIMKSNAIPIALLAVACSSGSPPPVMPTPAQAAEYDLEETAEWLMANLCADSRCRGDRPYRYSITRLNRVEIFACVMTLQYTGDRRPATIPLRDVWQIDLRSPSQLFRVTGSQGGVKSYSR